LAAVIDACGLSWDHVFARMENVACRIYRGNGALEDIRTLELFLQLLPSDMNINSDWLQMVRKAAGVAA
jgi:hypothetical protein